MEFGRRFYWDPILSQFVGTKKVLVKYDRFSMHQIWVKIEGVFYPINLSDLTLPNFTYEEYRASLIYTAVVRPGSLNDPEATRHYREEQKIEADSKKLTKRARRQQAAASAYELAYPARIVENTKKQLRKSPITRKSPANLIQRSSSNGRTAPADGSASHLRWK
ncbi:Mu transposase C-terminal domain-containing protein [Pseudomonas sp.]|uniref:Mu transposase C-terminal domain-containing protein n=1 Tax=Pseudomonas sp. TaxID=306 RepID=UPI003FD6D913